LGEFVFIQPQDRAVDRLPAVEEQIPGNPAVTLELRRLAEGTTDPGTRTR
jgi:hypothetical protein